MVTRPLKKSSRRQMQKDETRRIILASAYSLFGLKGYEKTTMRELAEHADVGLGTIFKHFPDKPSLLINSFREDIQAIIQNCFNTLPQTNIKMQLAHVATELYHFLGHNPLFSRTLIKESLFLQENHNELLHVEGMFLIDKIEKLFQDAIDRTELDPSTDCSTAALTCMSFFLLGLIGGLRSSEFDVKKQTLLFASLLDKHLSSFTKQNNL